MLRRLLPLLLSILLGACAVQPAAPAPSPTAPEAAALPSDTPAPSPTPESSPTPAPQDLPAPDYTLSASYDFITHRLSAVENIRYTNRAGEPIPDLLLRIDSVVYGEIFTLQALTAAAGPALGSVSVEGTRIRAALERPLAPGETIELEVKYELLLPQRAALEGLRPMVFGWSEAQTNLVDWYPYLPPYTAGQGWLDNPVGYYGEHQAYEASSFTVNLQTLNTPAGMIAAASAPEQLDGDWRRYTLDSARTFAVSFSSLYQVSTQQVGGVTVTSYFFPVHAAAGQRVLQTAAESVDLFSRLFAPYPHASLAVVEADFLDGMEYDGLFFLSNGFYNLYDGNAGNYLVALAAHETAHQWWYSLVGNDQANQPWLDEALATYAEKIYYENLYPDALRWWWDVRVLYYQPRGPVDDTIYNPRGEAQAYRAYRDAVYLNGAVFLDELRALMGDEAFFAFLKAYTQANSGKIATSAGFFELLGSFTSADLSPLRQKFFRAP